MCYGRGFEEDIIVLIFVFFFKSGREALESCNWLEVGLKGVYYYIVIILLITIGSIWGSLGWLRLDVLLLDVLYDFKPCILYYYSILWSIKYNVSFWS